MKVNSKKISAGLAAVSLLAGLGVSIPAQASSKTMMQLLEVLHKKGTIDQETFDLLKASALADAEKTQAEETEQKLALEAIENNQKDDSDSVITTLSGGKLKFKTADNAFKMQVGGRIMADAAWFDSDQRGLGSGTEIRRARLFAKGTFWNHWNFKAQFDFTGSDHIKDAYLEYTGLGEHLPVPLSIKVGHFYQPFGLETLTSSKYITFMERSLSNTFSPGRNIGLALGSHGKNWTATLGIYGDGFDNENSDNHESYGLSARSTYAPFYEKGRSLHLGGGLEYRQQKDQTVRVRTRPESHITDTRLVDASLDDVSDSIIWGLETAAVLGPFSLQAEYVDASYDRNDAANVNFHGWYSYASWFITGESRNYKASQGKFSRVKPNDVVGKGGWGAWELAVRYSEIDLNDGDVQGGRQDNVTVGLNWYATPSIRFMANYIFVDSIRNGIADDPQVFQVRSQIDF